MSKRLKLRAARNHISRKLSRSCRRRALAPRDFTRRLSVSTLVTLDGVGRGPGGSGEIAGGGWAGAYFNDEAGLRDRVGVLFMVREFLVRSGKHGGNYVACIG